MNEFANEFIEEGLEIIASFRNIWLKIERGGNDGSLLNAAFRAIHTIKGSGSSVGFVQLAAAVHHLEDELDALRQAPLRVIPPDEIDRFLGWSDFIERFLIGLKRDRSFVLDMRHLTKKSSAPLAPGQEAHSDDLAKTVSRGSHVAKNQLLDTAVAEILASLADLKVGQFSRRLALSDDPHFGPIIIKINELSQTLQDQAEQDRLFGGEAFFDLSPDLLCIAGIDGFFKRVNPAFCTVLGHSTEELTKRPFADFIHPNDRSVTSEEIAKLVNGSHTVNFENRFRCKDGSYVNLSWSAHPHLATGLLYAVARNITELKKTRLYFQKLQEAIDRCAIVATTDPQGRITAANANFSALSGYSAAELIGRPHSIINSGTHPKAFFADMWRTISSGHSWHGEITNRTKAGDLYTVATVIMPIFDSEGRIQNYLSIRFDVTKQKEAENSLIEAQRTAKLGNWKFDLESNALSGSAEHYRILEIENPQRPDRLYQIYRSKIHPGDIPALDKAIARATEFGEDFSYDHRIVFADGRIKYLVGLGRVIRAKSGKITMIVGTIQDITLQKQAEVQLVHSAKMASLGEMSAGVAHEINNPLAIIQGTANQLAKLADNPEKFISRIDSIKKASNRIAKIVAALKKFSRSSEGVIFTNHALASIVREALILTEAKSKRHDTPVTLDIKTEALISCDEVELEQVMINLIDNAIDAVSNCKEKWVKVELFDEGRDVVVGGRIFDGIPENRHRC